MAVLEPLIFDASARMTVGRQVLFIDLDGTLIPCDDSVSPTRRAWLSLGEEDFEVASTVSRWARDRDVDICIVSNQPDIARGHVSSQEVAEFFRLLMKYSLIPFAAVCPHDRNSCDCRKPQIGLLRAALDRWKFGIGPWTTLVGDRSTDLLAAKLFGITGRLVYPYPLSVEPAQASTSLRCCDTEQSKNYCGTETLRVVRRSLSHYPTN